MSTKWCTCVTSVSCVIECERVRYERELYECVCVVCACGVSVSRTLGINY